MNGIFDDKLLDKEDYDDIQYSKEMDIDDEYEKIS